MSRTLKQVSNKTLSNIMYSPKTKEVTTTRSRLRQHSQVQVTSTPNSKTKLNASQSESTLFCDISKVEALDCDYNYNSSEVDDKTLHESDGSKENISNAQNVVIKGIKNVNIASPKSKQQKRKNSLTDQGTPLKVPKLEASADVTETEESELAISITVKKPKALSEEELRAKKEQQMKYLQRFADISLLYTKHFENKFGSVKSSNASGDESDASTSTERDVTKQLKYFTGQLRPYQIEGVTWLTVLYENSVNGLLADDMGLGKTIQIIALFCHLYERKISGPFLIVAPLSTIGNWMSEFKRFAPDLPVFHLGNLSRQEQHQILKNRYLLGERKVKPVIVCSYQGPLRSESVLRYYSWQYIVVDEGHRIKNVNSLLSQALRAIQTHNRILLSGTPLQNNIGELWALVNFLMPDIFQDVEGFSSLLDLEDVMDKGKILEQEAETKMISTIHKVLAPFMLRREKHLVLHDMVPKREVHIFCSLSKMQEYLYRAVLERDLKKLTMEDTRPSSVLPRQRIRKTTTRYLDEIQAVDGRNYEAETKPVESRRYKEQVDLPFNCPKCPYNINLTMMNIMMMLKKAVNHPYLIWTPLEPDGKKCHLFIDENIITQSGKLLVLDALLPKLKKEGHKVLIFSTLVMFLDLIEEMLIMRDFSYRRLDGSRNFEDRNKSIDEFNSDPNIFIFILSTRAGGLGLNLTAADTVIFMDRDWNPMADSQAEDRCHRIGQTRPVMVYSLITKSTIDEVILNRGDMKKRLEKIIIKEGKFINHKTKVVDDELKELQDALNEEQKLTKVHANGLMYTDKELNKILDRSELIQEMQNKKSQY